MFPPNGPCNSFWQNWRQCKPLLLSQSGSCFFPHLCFVFTLFMCFFCGPFLCFLLISTPLCHQSLHVSACYLYVDLPSPSLFYLRHHCIDSLSLSLFFSMGMLRDPDMSQESEQALIMLRSDHQACLYLQTASYVRK